MQSFSPQIYICLVSPNINKIQHYIQKNEHSQSNMCLSMARKAKPAKLREMHPT
jgi:hypothetical protein